MNCCCGTSSFVTWWVIQYLVQDGKLRSHGNLVAHCQVFSLYARDASQKETSFLQITLLQNTKNLHHDSPAEAFISLRKVSLSVIDTSRNILSSRLHAKWQSTLHSSLDPLKSLLLLQAWFKAANFHSHLANGQKLTHTSEECAASQIQVDPLSFVLLSWWWEGPG